MSEHKNNLCSLAFLSNCFAMCFLTVRTYSSRVGVHLCVEGMWACFYQPAVSHLNGEGGNGHFLFPSSCCDNVINLCGPWARGLLSHFRGNVVSHSHTHTLVCAHTHKQHRNADKMPLTYASSTLFSIRCALCVSANRFVRRGWNRMRM